MPLVAVQGLATGTQALVHPWQLLAQEGQLLGGLVGIAGHVLAHIGLGDALQDALGPQGIGILQLDREYARALAALADPESFLQRLDGHAAALLDQDEFGAWIGVQLGDVQPQLARTGRLAQATLQQAVPLGIGQHEAIGCLGGEGERLAIEGSGYRQAGDRELLSAPAEPMEAERRGGYRRTGPFVAARQPVAEQRHPPRGDAEVEAQGIHHLSNHAPRGEQLHLGDGFRRWHGAAVVRVVQAHDATLVFDLQGRHRLVARGGELGVGHAQQGAEDHAGEQAAAMAPERGAVARETDVRGVRSRG